MTRVIWLLGIGNVVLLHDKSQQDSTNCGRLSTYSHGPGRSETFKANDSGATDSSTELEDGADLEEASRER